MEIPYELGLLGHSDADVLLHAVMDSLLGAAALGDIGKHFPDTDMEYKDADSMKLLENVASLIKDAGYVIVNLDACIVAQKPKISPYREQMVKNIANCLGIEETKVIVKATTTEKLGFEGRKEGISSHCICLIREEDEKC